MTDTPGPRRRWHRWIVVASPLLLLVSAACCLFFDLRIEDTTGRVGSALDTPLVFGVYISPRMEQSLDSLITAPSSAGSLSWQLEVQADKAGSGDAEVEFAFGPLQPNLYGSTGIGYSEDAISGTLPNPVDVVFMFPAGTIYPTHDPVVRKLDPIGPGDTCAQWSSAGSEHSVTPTILSGGGGGWPDVLICHIPAIPRFSSLQIAVVGDVPAPSLKASLTGTSALSVSNSRTLGVTMDQDRGSRGAIPQGLVGVLGQPFDLYLQPADGSTFSDVEPAPSGIGLQTRQVRMDPGGFTSAAMVNTRRRDVIDIVQQALLLLAGTLFGLIPAVLPFAARARRRTKGSGSGSG